MIKMKNWVHKRTSNVDVYFQCDITCFTNKTKVCGITRKKYCCCYGYTIFPEKQDATVQLIQ